jgi:hypothetical protein
MLTEKKHHIHNHRADIQQNFYAFLSNISHDRFILSVSQHFPLTSVLYSLYECNYYGTHIITKYLAFDVLLHIDVGYNISKMVAVQLPVVENSEPFHLCRSYLALISNFNDLNIEEEPIVCIFIESDTLL